MQSSIRGNEDDESEHREGKNAVGGVG